MNGEVDPPAVPPLEHLPRTLLAGALGGLAMTAAMLLTFGAIGFGPNLQGPLLDPGHQSPKLIAVWRELEPLPLILTNPAPMVTGFLILGVAHALVYRSVAAAWPPGPFRRGLRMAALLFILSYVFFEFFTPFNLFGEPLPLIALQLGLWSVVALAEGLVLAALMEWRPGRAPPA
jgi:hypothetical protein